jgi:hypothetical protein
MKVLSSLPPVSQSKARSAFVARAWPTACLSLWLAWSAGCGSPTPANTASPTGAAGARTALHPASGTNTTASAAAAPVPMSVFATNLDAGRDPFFPSSTRRVPRPTQVAAAATPVATARPSWNLLKLSGIWPSKNRPLAMINRTTVAPGEEHDISIVVTNGGNHTLSQKLRVRCLEVREKSVLVAVDGEPGTKELLMHARY